MSRKLDRIIGRIPVLESLRAGRRAPRRLLLLRSGVGLEDIRAAAAAIPIEDVSRDVLDRLVEGANHQGVVLEADPLPLLALSDWLAATTGPNALAVILDGIEDPQNFGAIVRTAAACGAAGVLFAKDRAAPVSTASVKAAAGAMEYVDLIQVTNVVQAIQGLQKAGFWVAALEADAPQLLWEADLTGRIALVVGSEGHGIRRLVRERSDMHLRIPLSGPISSLNASVSAAVAMMECVRQRTSGQTRVPRP